MKSLVIESAVSALLSAKAHAAKQGTLRSLRELQKVLFEDVLSTLQAISVAPDILVTSAAIGKQFRMNASDLADWIAAHPEGVAWPLTVATPVAADRIAMPTRILIMMPVLGRSAHLTVARGLLRHLAARANSTIAPEATGPQSAVFLGLQSDASGVWEYGAAAGILFERDGQVDSIVLPILPDVVVQRAASERCSPGEAASKFLTESVFDEIGMVMGAVHSGRPYVEGG